MKKNPGATTLRHVVVIPTLPNRADLLKEALASVGKQTRKPDRIICVIDSTNKEPPIPDYGPDVEWLYNRRTPGLSGALNSAFDHLLRTGKSPESVIVSLLDDDDRWDSNYLREVHAAFIHTPSADFGAASLQRCHADPTKNSPPKCPATVSRSDLLVGNPGIGGTNLSVRLSSALKAGLFNEALKSSTDRDFVLRLLSSGATYVAIANALCYQRLEHGGVRLSDPKSDAKRQGLDTFWQIWSSQMTSEERARCQKRAKDYFDWTPPSAALTPTDGLIQPRAPLTSESLSLAVGFIVDGNHPDRARALLLDLDRLSKHPRVQQLPVVLLENGNPEGFDAVVQRAQSTHLRVYPVRLQDQQRLAASSRIPPAEVHSSKSIAIARTLLQACVATLCAQFGDLPAWILDDDARLPENLDLLVDDIVRAKKTGHEVVIGRMTKAPPIPHGMSLRTQLVDLLHILERAEKHAPEHPAPHRREDATPWTWEQGDAYNDCSRRTDRLETPFIRESAKTTWRDYLREIVNELPGILRGEQVFRPIREATGDPLEEVRPSYYRGGNTFFFNASLMGRFANMSPLVNGRRTRRSDFIQASAISKHTGKPTMSIPISVIQDRSHDQPKAFDAMRLADDILGYAWARAYEENSTQKPFAQQVSKYVEERFASLSLSVWRVIGLCDAIEQLKATSTAWWTTDQDFEPIIAFIQTIKRDVTLDNLAKLNDALAAGLNDKAYLAFEPMQFDDEARVGAQAALSHIRVESARALLGHRQDSVLLGSGKEGVVFRLNDRVFKVFDGWTRDEASRCAPLLKSLMGSDLHGAIVPLRAVYEINGCVIAEMDYVESQPYTGSQSAALFRLTQTLVKAGYTYSNLHPDNLRLFPDGRLRLIDIGRSLECTVDDQRLSAMARRAAIIRNWPTHPDLKKLLSRSIRDPQLPEALGWANLRTEWIRPVAKRRLDHRLACIARDYPASTRHLDFACGKPGPLAQSLRDRDFTVCDIDETLRPRWVKEVPEARFLLPSALRENPAFAHHFNLITASLVLCAVDDAIANQILEQITTALAPGGEIIVTICDPTSRCIEQATHQIRETGCGCHTMPHAYQKRVHGSTQTRTEWHRPISAYRRLFAKHGLRIMAEEIIDELDVDRFERIGAFLIFRLTALPALPVRTTLIIKACAMETDTLEAQVEHLVSQLSRPRAFNRVLIAADTHQSQFPREHHQADMARFREKLIRLQNHGWIDGVIWTPSTTDALRRLAFTWFGVDSAASRAVNGQPVLTQLGAMDASEADLVLQVDLDVMVASPDPDVDPIAQAHRMFCERPRAVTLSLPARECSPGAQSHDEQGRPFRTEIRACWLHLPRLKQLLPLPNRVTEHHWELPWHRALDQKANEVGFESVRSGIPGFWHYTPDNAFKSNPDDLLLLLDRVEAGCCAPASDSPVMTCGPLRYWLGSPRSEKMVLVVAGRNVRPGRITRCFDSLRHQTFREWGLIVIDDASDNESQEIIARELELSAIPHTYIRRRVRVGLLRNTADAIKRFIGNPEAVVVLVDLDDALATPETLSQVMAVHQSGADLTVGGMIRTDKPLIRYPACFTNPRENRGGNVWQHLRTFRKRLFDRIHDRDFLDSAGMPFDLANDWAFMLPLVEMAEHPMQLEMPLYLHEPSTKRPAEEHHARDTAIVEIVAKPGYSRKPQSENLGKNIPVLCYHRVLPRGAAECARSCYERRDLVIESATFEQHLRELRRHHTILELSEYHEILSGTRGMPINPVLITFDDGYRDFIKHALPLLLRTGTPAVLFARAPLADGFPEWAPLDLLYHVLAKIDPVPERAELKRLRDWVIEMPASEQIPWIHAYAKDKGVPICESWRTDLYLSSEELKRLTSMPGIALGSHGLGHYRWKSMAAVHRQQSLVASRQFLCAHAVAGCFAISYPDGDLGWAHDVSQSGFFDLGFGLKTEGAPVSLHSLPRRFVGQNSVVTETSTPASK